VSTVALCRRQLTVLQVRRVYLSSALNFSLFLILDFCDPFLTSMMDERKKCKGCGTVVVKPIICSGCNTASHPACLPRTGHPYSNGLFINCKSSPRNNSEMDSNGDLLENIQKLIRSEFENLRRETLSLYQADLAKISDSIQSLSDRIKKLEVDLASGASHSMASLPHLEEDIIAELADRNRRSCNLILYNLDEVVDGSSPEESHKIDLSLAMDITQAIVPDGVPILNVTRLGGRRAGHIRPLRVTFPSKENASSILRNKTRYAGPIRIYQDQTIKQRKFLSDLRGRLKDYHDAGDLHKTIRFFNGVPKIVDRPTSSSSSLRSKKN